MIQGIEHPAICSPAPHELAAWYVQTLGFTTAYQSATTVIVKAADGTLLEITTAAGERAPQTLKSPGLRHMALTTTDFEADYAALKAANVTFLGEPADAKGVKVVYFSDPDGNFLHLIQRSAPL